MKKLLLSSFALLLFSASIIIFQFSCSKNAAADPSGIGYLQQNKIIFYKSIPPSIGVSEMWTASYNGSNASKINITLPAGFSFVTDGGVKLSPDGQTLFFVVRETSGIVVKFHIYNSGIDGANPQRIVEGVDINTSVLYLGAAY